MDIAQNDLLKCLDAFEEKEAKLLSWGDTAAFFTHDEVMEIISSALPHLYSEDVFIQLLDQAMLLIVPHPEGIKAYRSRMGEAMNLFRNLRQWFHGKPVEQSKTLVSDFRFIRRRRHFPERTMSYSDLLSNWDAGTPLSIDQKDALEALLSPTETFQLAGFQVRATQRISQQWNTYNEHLNGASGTIVSAGTGSGKTLAFYLPALSKLAEDLAVDNTSRVRILAIYPRKELLKDQFMETWSQCRKLDAELITKTGRGISIGAYFGDTQYNNAISKDMLKKSNRAAISFDLLRCVTDQCTGKMEWRKADIIQNKEIVRCSVCSHSVTASQVRLTRDAQVNSPPDILFTTTEMLNQQMGNTNHNHLFGVGNLTKGPVLVLLDEVHTYSGNTGAQVGYLLRRWMQLAKCRPHFVGLSATLADAESFFTKLIGARTNQVELITPSEDEMLEEGAEYLLALRGDPVSKTALLSTSIQASMLTRRILDTREKRSNGTWGTKVFAFTDDLDVKNRFFHGLCDAEGWRSSWRGLTPNQPPLALLRQPDSDYRKIQYGQNWQIAEDIGHVFSADARVLISETSSQSEGADSNSDVIVATASLEVGFNDPEVGAVIQHKAPRDVASYVQRKGRAGRQRSMRPWMLVVLSAFGRDRVAFQRYEELISPEITQQGLPFSNSHIQKMQAAMACLDWFSTKLHHVNVWSLLKPATWAYAGQQNERKILLRVVNKVIDGAWQSDVETYIRSALQLSDEELQSTLWQTPRSIMLEFLVSLRRLLLTDFSANGRKWADVNLSSRSPLPEYIPDALFSELNLANLTIVLLRGKNNTAVYESLPFFQGLREFAPGRISKRYGQRSDWDADWLVPSTFTPIADQCQELTFEINEAFGYRMQPELFVQDETGRQIAVFQPKDILTRPLDPRLGLSPKSNASLDWAVHFGGTNNVLRQAPPVGVWQSTIQDITFFTHQQLCPLEVTRYSTGSLASLRFQSGGSAHAKFSWTLEGDPVGIGSRQWVDGLRIRLQVGNDSLDALLQDADVLRAVRPVYFQALVAKQDIFEFDPFKADWVSECYLAAIASLTLQNHNESLEQIIDFLATEVGGEYLQTIPITLFQTEPSDEVDEATEQVLQAELREILASKEIRALLCDCANALFKPIDALDEILDWTKRVLANSLAAVFQQALYIILPDSDERGVVADTRWINPENDCLEIWLSESEPGGVGIISQMHEVYQSDPLRVLNIVMHATQAGQYEQLDYDLFNLLNLLESDVDLARALNEVRIATGFKERLAATDVLFTYLQKVGFNLTHSFRAVLFSRILKAGSSNSSDQLILRLLKSWRDLENKYELECSLNSASHALAVYDEQIGDTRAIFNRLCHYQNLLWPRGSSIRCSELNYYNVFNSGTSHTERLLVATLFKENIPRINSTQPGWFESLHDKLKTSGTVLLEVSRERVDDLTQIVTRINLEQLDHLGLLLNPRIGGLSWERGSILLRVELAESLQ